MNPESEIDLAPIAESTEPQLLVLSAETPSALEAMSHNLAAFLASPSADLQLAARTLQMDRERFSCRRFIVCNNTIDAIAALNAAPSKRTVSVTAQNGSHRRVVFMVPGVGEQYVGMGRGLYEHFPLFRQEMDRSAKILQPILNLDVRELLYPPNQVRNTPPKSRGIDLRQMLGRATDELADPASQKLNQTVYCHPTLFAVEYAISQLWLHWGVRPDRIVGHSMGEYVAACLAGVFSLEDALKLVAARAKLVNNLPQGSMLAVMQSEEKLLPLLGDQLSISLINGPELCVVAGPVAEMAQFENRLKEREIIFRPVRNVHPFHTRMLDPVLDSFAQEVKQVHLNVPRIPFISNVTGTWITEKQALDPSYWVVHARSTARFSDALEELWKFPDSLPLEVGPGRTLGVLAMQHPARSAAASQAVLSSLRHGYENQPDSDFILNGIGQLWLSGTEVAWEQLGPPLGRRKVILPADLLGKTRDSIEAPLSDKSENGVAIEKLNDRPDARRSNPQVRSAEDTLSASPEMPNRPQTYNGATDRKTPPSTDFQASADTVARPSTPTEVALAKIWCDVLGLNQIGLQDNFFDSGGQSLQALRIIADIRKHFERTLPLGSLFAAPTILQFSKLLDENADTAVAALSDGLRGKGSSTPVFYIPQFFGYGFLPVELADHLREFCRYYDGLQYPGLKPGEALADSIEEIAAYLIRQIRRIWPHGPYYLLGWSFGGAMAFEIARQMEASGAKIPMVLLLDSCCLGVKLRKRSALEIAKLFRCYLARLSGRERAIFAGRLITNKLKFMFSSLKRKNTANDMADNSLAQVIKASRRAEFKYRPGPYGGKVVLFQIENWHFYQGYRFTPPPDYGWEKLARGGLEIIQVPGDHLSLIREPYVSNVAQKIRAYLKATENEHAAV